MEQEFISIEFASSTVSELMGYAFNMTQKSELDETSKFLWKSLCEQLSWERNRLYGSKGNIDDVKLIIDRVNNLYCPFIKNVINKS